MGRKMAPIADTGPIGQFAQLLRDRRDAAVPRPTFREMATAATTYYTHSVFAEACAGKTLPTEAALVAFVTVLGADAEEVERWKADRLRVSRMVERRGRKLADVEVVVLTSTPDGEPVRPGRLRPAEQKLTSPEALVPNPDAARTFEDLTQQLGLLRIAVGNPSVRAIAYRALRTSFYSPARSTLGDLFSGKHWPTYETFCATVHILLAFAEYPLRGDRPDEHPTWPIVDRWEEAWRRADYNRRHPHRTRPTSDNNVFLMSNAPGASPIISVFAAMQPPAAAALLIGMTAEEVARVFEELPPEKGRELIREMEKLPGNTAADAEGVVTNARITDPQHALAPGTVVAMTSRPRRSAERG